MKSITVFCGSSFGSDTIYEEQAFLLGQTLAQQNIQLVYGGSETGLMGTIANGALSEDGKVTGVLPQFLQAKEIAHKNLTELILVETMHERKTKMNELCDGVIVLPGGYGTLEEFFEMITWSQLGLHKKPIGVLNTDGFYDDLVKLVDNMVDKGFLKQVNKEMLLISDNINDLLEKMKNYQAPTVSKWISKEKI
ncbi:TIGR00730 family Rossman fold protein [Chryseobacterium sp.]|uniref:LOG family protein n=1 Tax=Chryseobacterium sp. TaxID=1871047 RepID=UPI0025C2BE40|nr:TIGR00730 family Rossman fold protein [Chryseobacterium sp.]MBV8326214.1 TIGR00730 family Rossman fold protein [Chryseobacterium sp.]